MKPRLTPVEFFELVELLENLPRSLLVARYRTNLVSAYQLGGLIVH